jgi:hypothetical protein
MSRFGRDRLRVALFFTRSRSGRQPEPSADLSPYVLRVAERGESLLPGCVVAGIAIIDRVVAERSKLSAKRSECRVTR